VIAQLHGYCFGVGLELALACDFRVARDCAQRAVPELTLGMIPGSGGASRLVKLIGASRAKDVVMRGRRISAAEARAWGLLCEVVPASELGAAVAHLADELAARPALALRTAKRVIGQAQDAPLSVAMELEGLAYGLLRGTHDFAEGVSAFVEKRPPRYEDRRVAVVRCGAALPSSSPSGSRPSPWGRSWWGSARSCRAPSTRSASATPWRRCSPPSL